MLEITLFCEDSFHEKFVGAMLRRFSNDYAVALEARFLSSTGGLSRMHGEFKDFLRDLTRHRRLPGFVIVVADANCHGYNARKQAFEQVLARFPQLEQLVPYAIPDPHIERWMLADPKAFRSVFGRGCTLPALKCAKGEYKRLLRKEIRESGIDAPLGGEEFAEDVVAAMNLSQASREPSLGLFLRNLKAVFKSSAVR